MRGLLCNVFTELRNDFSLGPGGTHQAILEYYFLAVSLFRDHNVINEPHHDKTCFCYMQTTKAQISLRIRAVWSAPLLFAACIV